MARKTNPVTDQEIAQNIIYDMMSSICEPNWSDLQDSAYKLIEICKKKTKRKKS